MRVLSNNLVFGLVAVLLLAQLTSLTHHHDDNVEADPVCTICLVGENINHAAATASFDLTLSLVVSSTILVPRVQTNGSFLLTHHSRAPPVYL